MVFSSYIFLFVFLPLSLALYYAFPQRGRNLALTAVSYFFYAWANPYFVFLLMGSTMVTYCCGLAISRQQDAALPDVAPFLDPESLGPVQKGAFWFSVAANLSLLLLFKYFNFGVENFNSMAVALGLGGMQWQWLLRIALPLGISFYTFKLISYSIDVYQGKVRPCRNLMDFACYVSMFPQLVAGPIVRYQEVAGQLLSRSHTSEKFVRGVSLMCLGLAKKVLIADPCGKVADTCFNAGAILASDAWFGLFAYSLQIYFDFSSYSDMAIGLCLMFGFVIPKNFDSPYKADSFADFWRRWHISLSSWLRDYLFTPLSYLLLTDRVRNRMIREKFRRNYPAIVSSIVVFTVCGIWHGAGWTFAVWGAIHGFALALEQLQGKKSFYKKMPKAIRGAVTFLVVSLAWVFFRASDLAAAGRYLKSLFGFGSVEAGSALIGGIIYQPYYLLSIAVAAFLVWGAPQTWDFTRSLDWRKTAWCAGALAVSVVVLVTKAHSPFIYSVF